MCWCFLLLCVCVCRSEKDASLVGFSGVSSEDESLAATEHLASSSLALGAFESKSDLLGLLGLLSEDGLCLSTETLLLRLITAGTLGETSLLTLLVLSHLVFSVILALLAVRILRLRGMHLFPPNKHSVRFIQKHQTQQNQTPKKHPLKVKHSKILGS